MRLPNGYGSVTKMSGKRRKPYMVRKTVGWHYDAEKDKQVQDYVLIGYASTKAEGLKMLADYHESPIASDVSRLTFDDIYSAWSKEKYPTISKSHAKTYRLAYNNCSPLYKKIFREIKTADLQHAVDTCGKNYPTLLKVSGLFSQMYKYAMQHDICNKDYSKFVNISQYKDRNPNKYDRKIFTAEEISMLWEHQDDIYCQTVLMLIYSGVRVSELLDLKKVDVHLDKQYFDVQKSKTASGIRSVPIADKLLPFYNAWYNRDPSCEYLLCNKTGEHFTYFSYYDNYFAPPLIKLGISHTPHCCRHTFVSMMAEAKVEPTITKMIVGHVGAMSLTERVYTHLEIQTLIDAVNKI